MSEYFMNPDFVRAFIDIYRSQPCLWQVRSSEYQNKQKKNEAYQTLVDLSRQFYPRADKDLVKTKIKNLRTVFRKELRKVKLSEKLAATDLHLKYTPKLWYYDLLSFIADQESASDSRSSYEHDESEREDEEDMDVQRQFIDPMESASLSGLARIYKEEDGVTTLKTTGSEYKTQTFHDSQLSQISATYLTKNIDEHDAFGMTVAAKLRKMNPDQRLLAEVLISQILYKGMTNSLSEDSDI